ncbi:MAG: hypothetical protein BRD55_06890 [Bacteroidetes bacterium SW_9_63_38]|nr:MAG: hypothetical protein BRD55_06890 [Bacteroidetes bacterium SW_9_63_38]
MNLLFAMIVVVGFAAVLELLNLPARARDAGQRSQDCLRVLQNDSLTDCEKEEALQSQTKHLFRLLGILAGGSLLALGGPLGAVWGLNQLGVGTFSGVLGILQRIDFLAGTVVAGTIAYALVSRRRTS